MRDQFPLSPETDAGIDLVGERGKLTVFNRPAEQLQYRPRPEASTEADSATWKWRDAPAARAAAAACPPVESLSERMMQGQQAPARESFLGNHDSSLEFRVDASARPLLDHAGDGGGGDDGFGKGEEARFRRLIDSAAEAICEINLAGDCTFANSACAKLLGYQDASLLLGKNLHALTHSRRADGAAYPEAECPIHRNSCHEQGVEVEDLLWRADGTSFHADCRSLPMLRGNRAIGAVVTFRDITPRKQLEEQLDRAQKLAAIGRQVGGIAHDFNNFLTAMNIYHELLADSLGSLSAARPLLQEVKGATVRLASLTRQLLELGGKQSLAPRTLCLNAFVRNAEGLLRRLTCGGVSLDLALDPLLDKTEADPEQLERVLLNLVVNARDAMPREGRITIASTNVTIDHAGQSEHQSLPAGRYVSLSVTDTGAGMSPDVKRRIFEPFFTTKGPEKGSGLGLAVVQEIVKQLKGGVEVDSEPGCGARFTIYLPSAQQPTP